MSRARTPKVSTKFQGELPENVLDLSGKGLKKMSNLPKKSSVSKLILDHNNITKIEKLEAFPKLSALSMAHNHLVRMNGVNFGKNLTTLNLSNNGIVSMEGLCWLVHLEHLDLSKNNIKRIQNVSYCVELKYMDLSENSISDVSDLNSLIQLKVLFLHGNTITMLQRATVNLPEQLETLSLAGNGISDLNEFMIQSGFDYRPFLLFCSPSLLSLDGFEITDTERNDAERLRRDENLALFSVGHHLQLILYLSKTCPLATASQLHDDQNKFLDNFLERQRLEKFTGKQTPEDGGNNAYSFTNGEHQENGTFDGNSGETLESSGLNHLGLAFSEYSKNESGHLTGEEGEQNDVNDLLCSESSFLPVYSPLKKSIESDNCDYPTELEQSGLWDTQVSSEAVGEDFPIMTEEEANKLIHLAATILQSHIRGFLVRRKFDFKNFKRKHDAASRIQAFWKGYYFRHRSFQGINFKNELRVRRLQKYVATLCLMMQKAEQQHEIEKQQLVEAVTLLYGKLTQLSDRVERQDMENKNKQIKLERTAAVILQKHWRGYVVRKVKYLDSLMVSATDTREPCDSVFLPHPRLSGPSELVEMQNTDNASASSDFQTETLNHCVGNDQDDMNEQGENLLDDEVDERECAENDNSEVEDEEVGDFEVTKGTMMDKEDTEDKKDEEDREDKEDEEDGEEKEDKEDKDDKEDKEDKEDEEDKGGKKEEDRGHNEDGGDNEDRGGNEDKADNKDNENKEDNDDKEDNGDKEGKQDNEDKDNKEDKVDEEDNGNNEGKDDNEDVEDIGDEWDKQEKESKEDEKDKEDKEDKEELVEGAMEGMAFGVKELEILDNVKDERTFEDSTKESDEDTYEGTEELLSTIKGTALDVKELEFADNEVDGISFENLEGNDEELDEDITAEDEELSETDIKGEHPLDSVILMGDEEHGRKEEINRDNVDQTVDFVEKGVNENVGIIDNQVGDSSEKVEAMTEADIKDRNSDDLEGEDGTDEEPRDQEDHFGTDVKFRDGKDETFEEIKDLNVEHNKESSVDGGDNNEADLTKEGGTLQDIKHYPVGSTSAHKVLDVPSKHAESTSEVCRSETTEKARTTSSEITKDIEGQKSANTTNHETHHGTDECNQGDDGHGGLSDTTSATETDTKRISPRLGKRASGMLSALKAEISNASAKSNDESPTP